MAARSSRRTRRGLFDPEYLAIVVAVLSLVLAAIEGSVTMSVEGLGEALTIGLVITVVGAGLLVLVLSVTILIRRIRLALRGGARAASLWLDVLLVIMVVPLVPGLLGLSGDGLLAWEIVRLAVILLRASVAARRIWGPSLTSVAVITAFFAVGSGALYPLVEDGTTTADGIWWSLVTVTTVGYGDVVPDSTSGRLLGSVLIVVGVALVAILTAGITARLVRDEEQVIEVDVEAIRVELGQILDRLDAIERRLAGGSVDPEQPA